jgi:hypothetical protein
MIFRKVLVQAEFSAEILFRVFDVIKIVVLNNYMYSV